MIIFVSGCVQKQVPENFIYVSTLYTNCHANPNFPVQTDKQTITISGIASQQQGSMMFPWRAAIVKDYALFDANTGHAIYNFDEMIGKSVVVTGYTGFGDISEPAFYNKSVILSQNFTKALYVTNIKDWQNVCCSISSGAGGSSCMWFPTNYKFEEPECIKDSDCAQKPIPAEFEHTAPGCKVNPDGSSTCPQQKWICESGKCLYKIIY